MPYLQALQISLQLVQAVQQLHALPLLHLYIQPQHVLLDKYGAAVLSHLSLLHGPKTEHLPSESIAGATQYRRAFRLVCC